MVSNFQVSNFDGDLWTSKAFQLVKEGILYKFQQNPKIKETLLSTGDAILCEASGKDVIWGIGLPINVNGKPVCYFLFIDFNLFLFFEPEGVCFHFFFFWLNSLFRILQFKIKRIGKEQIGLENV